MAITGTKAFTSGEVLTANDVNQYLMRGVKVFSSTAVRDAAYGGAGEPVLEEGETAFITGTDTLQVYGGTAVGWLNYPTTTQSGKVLQVVSTTKTDAFTSSSTTFVDLTGLTVTITPSSATSKILVTLIGQGQGTAGAANMQYRLMRDSTAICVGDAAGNRQPTSGMSFNGDNNSINTFGAIFLDSPNTTSATVYKTQVRLNTASTMYVNRSPSDADLTSVPRMASTITVMEISA